MKGIIAAKGMALALAHVVTEPELAVQKRTISDVPGELKRLNRAVAACSSQIESLMEEMKGTVDPQTIEILDFQLLMLEDADFIGGIENAVAEQSVGAEYAVKYASDKYITNLEELTDNDYLRQRAPDVADTSRRLIAELYGVKLEIKEPDEPYVAIGTDIPPSRVAELDKSKLKGIILEKGGITSHCVILSKSLGISCLIETTGILEAVKPGDTVLLDAIAGEATINPDEARVRSYNEYKVAESKEMANLKKYSGRESKSLDGAQLKVFANITTSDEAESVVSQGGEGVGLFRSELLYMAQTSEPPSEETQYKEYSKAAKALRGRPLIIRTLDIGGDKNIPYMDIGQEDNPFLGYRAIRFCLDNPEIFKPQISAILRAGAVGNVWMMFPMIASKTELTKARQMVDQVAEELIAKGIPFDSSMKIGMMVETPAAAADAKIFAKEVDFFSIGTNDLSQYLFAADRANAKLASLNSHFQPTLLRVIHSIAAAAKDEAIDVDICGQAGEVDALIPIWLAMGIDNLSVSLPRITAVRRRICNLYKSDCERLLESVLCLDKMGDVAEALKEFAEKNPIHET